MDKTNKYISTFIQRCIHPTLRTEAEWHYYFVGLQPICYQGQNSYIMYHGTTLKNAARIMNEGFRRSTGGILGPGVYVTRSFEKASNYPTQSYGQPLAVLKLCVRVGKVKKITYQGHPLQMTWHMHGYDTAWVPPNCGMVPSGLEEDCVYDPRHIKVLDIFPNRRYW